MIVEYSVYFYLIVLKVTKVGYISISRYRLAAVDHGQFSFIDVKHKEWPVVLITNPKHALYVMPRKESLLSVIKSTHIR